MKRGDHSGLRRTVGDGSRGIRPSSVGRYKDGVLYIKPDQLSADERQSIKRPAKRQKTG